MKIPAGNDVVRGGVVRSLLSLTWPMMTSALLQNLQSVIDLFWVGNLGSHAVAALALSVTILMTLFPLLMGAATGTVAMVSRRVGEGRHDEASRVCAQSLSVGAALGLAAGALGFVFAERMCALLGAGPDSGPAAVMYLKVTFAGSVISFLLFIGNSALQAAGNALAPMLSMLAATALNLVLDPIMIFGLLGAPALGVRGAALATVISQFVAMCVTLGLLLSGRVRIHMRIEHFRPDFPTIAGLVRVGLPGSGQMLARSLMALVLMRVVAGCGTVAVAGYGIGLRFQAILLMPAFAIANAAATMMGQNLGAGRPDRAARAAWTGALVDSAIMAAAALTFYFAAERTVWLFDRNPEVIKVGASFIRITTGFYVFTALAIVLGRALQGAGDTVAPMISTVIALWGVQVPLAIWLSARTTPPTDGIWWAIAAAITLHGLMVTGWFSLGRWKHRRV